jgi:hypothetical protein
LHPAFNSYRWLLLCPGRFETSCDAEPRKNLWWFSSDDCCGTFPRLGERPEAGRERVEEDGVGGNGD